MRQRADSSLVVMHYNTQEDQLGCLSGFRSITLASSGKAKANVFQRLGKLKSSPSGQKSESSTNLSSSECVCSWCDFSPQSLSEKRLEESESTTSFTSAPDRILAPEAVSTIDDVLDQLSPALRQLSLQIHDHPEIMFQEKFAHDTLTDFMETHGFSVERHYLNIETAWRAEFATGKGGRVLGINSEMDALPLIGHACGHNLIAVSGVGVAIAVKAALQTHSVPGKVVLLGTPAEESGGGKIILLKRGGYKDMDACIMCHPSSGPVHSTSIPGSLAMQAMDVEFCGRSAHASAAPWEGTNALDAAFLAYSGISALRQQIRPDHRVHGVIQGTDGAANVIPDHARMRWYIRAPTLAQVLELRERVRACFQGAAVATGCQVKITLGELYNDLRQNSILAEDFLRTVRDRYGVAVIERESASVASTDFGNVSYELPSLHPAFAIPTEPKGGNHSPAFARSARTTEAHKACMTITKGLALAGLRLIKDDEFYKRVKDAFENSNGPC